MGFLPCRVGRLFLFVLLLVLSACAPSRPPVTVLYTIDLTRPPAPSPATPEPPTVLPTLPPSPTLTPTATPEPLPTPAPPPTVTPTPTRPPLPARPAVPLNREGKLSLGVYTGKVPYDRFASVAAFEQMSFKNRQTPVRRRGNRKLVTVGALTNRLLS